jgi:FG-GAP-like repeat/ASPIC and UnbV/PPIC-type PPIASE domain
MLRVPTKPVGSAYFVLVMVIALGPSLPGQTPPTNTQSLVEIPLELIVVGSLEEAQHILDRLKKGEDFAHLAREKSIDPTAESSGFMGKLDPRDLRAELRDALRGVGPGQITPIVHIPSGYAILKVMEQTVGGGSDSQDPARAFAMAASGTVKYVSDVDGLAEAEAILTGFPKNPGWNANPQTVCALRRRSLADIIARLKELTSPDHPEVLARHSAMDVMQAHFALAQLYAFEGNMDPAIEQYQASYRIALKDVPAAVPQMEEALGVIYLHKSEMENDVYRVPGKKCLFPMHPEDAFVKTDDSRRAIEYFLKYLETKPTELEVRWLLNLAYMTIGKYPAAVPEHYLIPPSTFESKEDVGRFLDVAPEMGLNSFSEAGGLIVDDFENNGHLDVVTSSFDSCGSLHYFHNNGDGTFTDQTEKAGLSGQFGGLNIMQTDYNNDGCLDILVLRGAWEFAQSKSLLRNNCDGTFTDVTAASGLAEMVTSTQAAVWADINNDGWLDLFVANENGPAQLFLNKGDGTFEDISPAAGVDGGFTTFAKGVAAADYDNDGYVDLYVSSMNGRNYLYHNNHDNTFTDVSQKAGVPGSGKGFSTWFFDFDNDGLPDIFATSYFVSVDETIRTYLDLPHNATTLKLYKNLGDGTFRDVTASVGLDKVFMPMGANFGDVDNDGYLDIYLGTGNPSYASLVPNVLLRNHDGKYFVDITSSSGTGELHKGHGVAFADLFNTGDEDIVEEIGGATPGDAHALRVFANPGHGNDWINLKLVGVKTNRAAIGTRIKITVESEGHRTRSIYRTVGSGGSFGASPLEQHVGLGKSARILGLDIFWPASNTHQVFSDIDKNQFLEIKEFAATYRKLDRTPVPLRNSPDVTASVRSRANSAETKKP